MKKVFYLVLMIFIFFACSSDEDDNATESIYLTKIIGSWAYDTVKIDGVTYQYQHIENCEKDIFQFYNQEGKEFDFEELIILDCPNCAECATSGTNLKWELNDDVIKLYFGETLVLEYLILSVTNDSFTYQVYADTDNDGVEEEYEITGIRYDPYGDFN